MNQRTDPCLHGEAEAAHVGAEAAHVTSENKEAAQLAAAATADQDAEQEEQEVEASRSSRAGTIAAAALVAEMPAAISAPGTKEDETERNAEGAVAQTAATAIAALEVQRADIVAGVQAHENEIAEVDAGTDTQRGSAHKLAARDGELQGTIISADSESIKVGDGAGRVSQSREQYQQMRLFQLKNELRARGLEQIGTFEELVERLLVNDHGGHESDAISIKQLGDIPGSSKDEEASNGSSELPLLKIAELQRMKPFMIRHELRARGLEVNFIDARRDLLARTNR